MVLFEIKGSELSDLIEKYSFNVIKNIIRTLLNNNESSKSKNDLMLISNELSDKLNFFKVYNENLTSDHFLIKTNFSILLEKIKVQNCIKIKRIDWAAFKNGLAEKISQNSNGQAVWNHVSRNIFRTKRNLVR